MKRRTKARGRRNGRRADDAADRRPGNECGYRVGQPHVRNRGRADELIRARGSTDPGSFQSLQHMFLGTASIDVLQMTVTEIIHVIVMSNGYMTTTGLWMCEPAPVD